MGTTALFVLILLIFAFAAAVWQVWTYRGRDAGAWGLLLVTTYLIITDYLKP